MGTLLPNRLMGAVNRSLDEVRCCRLHTLTQVETRHLVLHVYFFRTIKQITCNSKFVTICGCNFTAKRVVLIITYLLTIMEVLSSHSAISRKVVDKNYVPDIVAVEPTLLLSFSTRKNASLASEPFYSRNPGIKLPTILFGIVKWTSSLHSFSK